MYFFSLESMGLKFEKKNKNLIGLDYMEYANHCPESKGFILKFLKATGLKKTFKVVKSHNFLGFNGQNK